MAFCEKKPEVLRVLNGLLVASSLPTLFLAFRKTEKKGKCHSDSEGATIKPGVTKKNDREVHVSDAMFAISVPIFICGCFLEIGEDKYACVVLGCSVQNGS